MKALMTLCLLGGLLFVAACGSKKPTDPGPQPAPSPAPDPGGW